MTYLIFQSSPWLVPALTLVVLVLAIELPYRLLPKFFSYDKSKTDPLNALQAGLLTLSAFVLSLSFSEASARFDSPRALVVAESNAIGTTWLRADQLESAQSNQFRQILVDDAAARIVAYGEPNSSELYRQKNAQSDHDQDELWAIASSALHAQPLSLGRAQLRQSLNDMIDVASQQRQTFASHVPTPIILLVLVLVTLGAFSLGIRFALDGSRPLFMSLTYVLAYVVVISMMIDYDRPSTGFVTVSVTPLTSQLQSMERALKAPTIVPRVP